MQNEIESMEDYWQKKINEERELYEEQLNVHETKCQELDARMKEYKELLESFDYKENLYIIEEQRSLEEKVNEWEEEIGWLKLQLNELQAAQ